MNDKSGGLAGQPKIPCGKSNQQWKASATTALSKIPPMSHSNQHQTLLGTSGAQLGFLLHCVSCFLGKGANDCDTWNGSGSIWMAAICHLLHLVF